METEMSHNLEGMNEEYWELRLLLINALDDKYHQVKGSPEDFDEFLTMISDFVVEVSDAGEQI